MSSDMNVYTGLWNVYTEWLTDAKTVHLHIDKRCKKKAHLQLHLNRVFLVLFLPEYPHFVENYSMLWYYNLIRHDTVNDHLPRNDKNFYYELELILLPKILQLMASQPECVGSAVSA